MSALQPPNALFANLQPLQGGPVPRLIDAPQIIQEPTAPADQLQETTSRMVIFLVQLKMIREISDAVRQYRDLHFRRSGIPIMLPVLPDQVRFRFLHQGHLPLSFLFNS